MVVLGVDPGVVVAGFSVIGERDRRLFLYDCGAAKLSATAPLPERLTQLHDFFSAKIIEWQVTDLALETPFLGKNAQNFLKLGYVRGILYLLAHRSNLRIHEFAPREVKRSITGFGGAEKEQLARVILNLFPGLVMPDRYDVTDAVAVALCGAWNKKTLVSSASQIRPN